VKISHDENAIAGMLNPDLGWPVTRLINPLLAEEKK
jgi:hypothetical protein